MCCISYRYKTRFSYWSYVSEHETRQKLRYFHTVELYNKRLQCNTQNNFGLRKFVWRKYRHHSVSRHCLLDFWFLFGSDTHSEKYPLCQTNTSTKSLQLSSQAPGAEQGGHRGIAQALRAWGLNGGAQWSTRHKACSSAYKTKQKISNVYSCIQAL